jgi:UDP-N-acetylglucosamine 2-epimerase
VIVSIVGARPQFIKAAVVSRALENARIPERIIHTGQHYDAQMSRVFWDELGIPPVEANLEVGSGSQGAQTGRMIERIEARLLGFGSRVQGVLLYGDTNSTLSGAIAAAKLGIDIYHVEAGLRSYNRRMPEEVNRVLTDRLSRALFCPSSSAVAALASESITEGVFEVGDVMFDALRTFREIAERRVGVAQLLPFSARPFLVLTVHRSANTETPEGVQRILCGVAASGLPVVWPVHPRVRACYSALEVPRNVFAIGPVSYLEMLALLRDADGVVTDSGGLQKEAYWMQKRCITTRDETEWVETLSGGWNQLAGSDPERIASALAAQPSSPWTPLYGDGNAASAIAQVISRLITEQ